MKDLNPMCKDCARYGRDCMGTKNPVYTGCVNRVKSKEERK